MWMVFLLLVWNDSGTCWWPKEAAMKPWDGLFLPRSLKSPHYDVFKPPRCLHHQCRPMSSSAQGEVSSWGKWRRQALPSWKEADISPPQVPAFWSLFSWYLFSRIPCFTDPYLWDGPPQPYTHPTPSKNPSANRWAVARRREKDRRFWVFQSLKWTERDNEIFRASQKQLRKWEKVYLCLWRPYLTIPVFIVGWDLAFLIWHTL